MTISGRWVACSVTVVSSQFWCQCDPRTGRTALPADDRQLLNIGSPDEALLSLTEPLQLHGQLTLLDFVLREDL